MPVAVHMLERCTGYATFAARLRWPPTTLRNVASVGRCETLVLGSFDKCTTVGGDEMRSLASSPQPESLPFWRAQP
jgi:hypothetical protein